MIQMRNVIITMKKDMIVEIMTISVDITAIKVISIDFNPIADQ